MFWAFPPLEEESCLVEFVWCPLSLTKKEQNLNSQSINCFKIKEHIMHKRGRSMPAYINILVLYKYI